MKRFGCLIVFGLMVYFRSGVCAQQPGTAGVQQPGAAVVRQAGAAGVQAVLTKARQGQVVLLPGFFPGKIPELSYTKKVLSGPQFIISDDPEYIRDAECIALREKVSPGAVRLYVYN